ncbi:Sec1-like protein [Umbelopsis sp. PMI_123]|nr:Sec1-like protein [Umbelopsis sp. PMI_123]
MIGIDEILKRRFLETIKSVQPAGRWKIVVVDSRSLKILSSACRMYDILEENVTLVENIEKQRQPYPNLEAIYILTPCIESASRLVDDFSRKGGPMYAAAHVHFTSGLENKVFEELTRKLRVSDVSKYIHSLKEMYVDFYIREAAVFSLNSHYHFAQLFGKESASSNRTSSSGKLEANLDDIAKQILSVCATVGENPLIRYHRPLDVKGTVNRNIPWHLAKLVQQELDNFCKLNPEFPPARDPPLPRGTLIILDRTIDHLSPFLNEFTYQAMMTDLLNVEESPAGLKYSYEYVQEDGLTASKEIVLDEQDSVYTSIRHMHIANTTEKLIESFNEFIAQNKGAGGSSKVRSLNDMKEVMANLPQFQEMKSKFSAHMTIAADCMNEFNTHNLDTIGLTQQNLACGETPDGDSIKHIEEEMLPVLDDPYTSQYDKTRLLMLWIASSEGQVDEDKKQNLLAHARLDQDYKEAIENLSLLGVQLSKSANKQGEKSKKEKKKQDSSQEVPYDLSRYVPVVKRVSEAHIKETIDQSLFPLIRVAEPENKNQNTKTGKKYVPQLRVYHTKWHKKTDGSNAGPKPPSGPPVIIFVAGGITYSEIRSAYELAEAYDREVYIGSTHIITPNQFIDDLISLDRPLATVKTEVPAYTAAAAAATKTLPPRTSSSQPSNSKLHMKKW